MSNPTDFSPNTYVPRVPARELDAAHFAPLTACPVSQLAIEACRELMERMALLSGSKVTSKQTKALGAIVAELLEHDPAQGGGWLFRSMDPASFNGQEVGYKPFIAVYSAMTANMIEEIKGNRVWGPSEIAKSGKLPVWQRATRFRATPELRRWFADRGITREDWKEHFRRDLSPPPVPKGVCPVVLRTGKPPHRFGARRGRNIPVDRSDPQVAALITRMERINAYLAEQEVLPSGSVFLRRIFAQGDDPDHGWHQGGRLYAMGSTPYQTMKKAKRAEITINGQTTCELDIQASHLTILAGFGHISLFEGDPYEIEGLPRPVVKRWVNMTLSHGKRHVRWPPRAVSDLMKGHGIDLKADHPIIATGDAILRHLPILKGDGRSSVAVGWGELQFWESEVVLSCMETLAFQHDTPALPVHDSLIVPQDARDLAKAILEDTFEEVTCAPEM